VGPVFLQLYKIRGLSGCPSSSAAREGDILRSILRWLSRRPFRFDLPGSPDRLTRPWPFFFSDCQGSDLALESGLSVPILRIRTSAISVSLVDFSPWLAPFFLLLGSAGTSR